MSVESVNILSSRSRIFGIGLVAFAVLALLSLLSVSEGGAHPLALKTDVDLCGVLGDDIWAQLAYPAGNPVARAPQAGEADVATCVLELDPVAADDRWGRVARGEDADQTRRIATVTLTTTAALRRQNPALDSEYYARQFDHELVASGWASASIEGPWSWGSVYTLPEAQAATLAEDHGVVLWVTASGVEPMNLIDFSRTASERIHSAE